MLTLVFHPLVAMLATLHATAPCALVTVQSTGLAEAVERHVVARISDDVISTGADVCASGPPLAAECADDRACSVDAMKAAGAAFIVSAEVLRAGAQANVSAKVLDADGRVLRESQRKSRADALQASGPLLPADVTAALAAAVRIAGQPAPVAARPPPEERPAIDHSADAVTTQPETAPTHEESAEPAALTPLAIGGVAVIAGGALLAAGAGAVIAGQFGVIRSSDALGEDKENAAVLIPLMVAVGGVGLVAAGTGGVLVWIGMR